MYFSPLEDVVAKAVVLPKRLALVAILWPLQRRREALQLIIKQRLEKVLQQDQSLQNDVDKKTDDNIGFWLREIRNRNIETSDIAEYIVGLLFAAHKNPAIGAAQSYLLMQEHASDEVLIRCQKESANLVSSTSSPTWSQFKSSCPTLRRVCLESLRLTAHSIGGVRISKSPLTVSVKADDDGNSTKNEKLYNIPKGSTIAFAHIASSLDTSIWGEDAAVFNLRRPEDLYMDDYKFTTFSHGVHKCPGRELAMIQLQAVVAILLTEFDVSLPKPIPSLCFERATLAQRDGPVMVSIRPKQKY